MVELIGRLANPVHPDKTLEELESLLARLTKSSHARPEPQPFEHSAKLTPTQVKELIAAYRAGTSTTVLMKHYGIGKGTILNLLDRHHVAKRRRPPSTETLKQATLLYEHGLSLAAIAERLDVPQSTLRRHLKKKGVVLRPRGGSVPRGQE